MLAAIAVTTNPVPADVLLVDQPAENVKLGHNSLCSRRREKKHTKCCRPKVAVPLGSRQGTPSPGRHEFPHGKVAQVSGHRG